MCMKIKTNLKQKFFLGLFGVVLGVVLVEIFLRIGGFIFIWNQERWNEKKLIHASSIRILCIGESTTSLGKKDDYPNFLEKFLNENSDGHVFSVINLGVPSITTGRILEKVPRYLEQYDPHIVITMMGINDVIYNEEYTPDLNGEKYLEKQGFVTIAKKFRFYNLIRWVSEGIYGRMKWIYKEQDIVQAKKAIDMSPYDEALYLKLGCIYYYNHGKRLLAEKMFKKAIEINPDSAPAYFLLGHLYHNWRYDARLDIQMLEKSLDFDTKQISTYMELVTAYLQENNYEEVKKTYERAVLNNPDNDWGYAGLASIYRKEGNIDLMRQYEQQALEKRLRKYESVTYKNYNLLKRLLKIQEIQLIAVQYPMRNIMPLKKMLGENDGVLFVDNEEIFKNAVGQYNYDEYFIDQFAGDFGHATSKGNQLLARNVAEAVINYYKERNEF